MLNFFLKKIMGTQNERALKLLRPAVGLINSLEPKIAALSDTELRAKTDEFREAIAKNYRDYFNHLWKSSSR